MNMEQRRTSETRPEAAGLPSDWSEVLSDELYEPYWSKLMAFVDAARADHAVYPPADARTEDLVPAIPLRGTPDAT